MNKKEIKAIIFDIGGVLSLSKNPISTKRGNQVYSGTHQRIAKKLGISIDQWFDSIDAPYSLSTVGGLSEEKTLQMISKNTKTPEKKLEKIIVSAYKKVQKPNNTLYKFALRLKKQGYKIAILSDQWAFSKQAYVLKKYYKNFNPIIISCDVKVRKPNLKIYKIILKKLKFKPQETIFIDNQEWNIRPAKKLGMKTVLFKNNKQTIKNINKLLMK